MPRDPQELLSPRSSGSKRLERTGKRIKRTQGAFKNILSEAGYIVALSRVNNQEQLLKSVVKYVKDTQVAERPELADMSPAELKKEILPIVTYEFDEINKDFDKAVARRKNAFHKKIDEGGISVIQGDLEMSPGQVKKANLQFDRISPRDKEWSYTPHQALRQTLDDIGDDISTTDLAGLILYAHTGEPWDANQDAVKTYDENIQRRHVGFPDRSGPAWLKYPLETMGAPGAATHGVLEAAMIPVQEQLIEEGYTPKPTSKPLFDLEEHPEAQDFLHRLKKESLKTAYSMTPMGIAGNIGEIGEGVYEALPESVQDVAASLPYTGKELFKSAAELKRGVHGMIEGVDKPELAVTPEDLFEAGKYLKPPGPQQVAEHLKGVEYYAGVPVGETLDRFASELPALFSQAESTPERPTQEQTLLGKTLMAGAEAPTRIWDPHKRRETILRSRSNVAQMYEKGAVEEAKKRIVSGSMEEVSEEADRVYRDLWERDSAIKDPDVAMMVGETALDPTMTGVIHPLTAAYKASKPIIAAGAKGAKAAIGTTKRGQRALEAAGGIKQAFQWAPEMEELGAAAPELAAAGRAAITKAQAEAPTLFKGMEEILAKMPKEGSTESAELMRAVQNPEKYRFGFTIKYGDKGIAWLKQADEFSKQLAGVQEKTGMRNYYDDAGNLLQRPRREKYVATDIRQPDVDQEKFDKHMSWLRGTSIEGRVGPFSEAHAKKDVSKALQDWTKQMRVKMVRAKQAAPRLLELKEHAKVLDTYGSRVQVTKPYKIQSAAELAKTERALKKAEARLEKIQRLRIYKIKPAYELLEEKLSIFQKGMREGATDATVATRLDPEHHAMLAKQRTLAHKRSQKLGHIEGQAKAEVDRLKVQQLDQAKAELRSIQDDKVLEKTINELSERDGVQYVPLDTFDRTAIIAGKKRLIPPAEAFQRITGEVGETKLGGKIDLVPEPYAKRIDSITRTIGVDQNKALRGLSDMEKYFMGGFVRPTQRFWRGTHTLLSVPYYMRNAFGAFGLSTIAHGAKALDPKLQSGAIQAGLMSGRLFDEELRLAKWVTPGGVETTLGEMTEAARKMGIIDVSDHRIAMGMSAKGPVDAAAKWVEDLVFKGRVSSKHQVNRLSPANINKVIDNYQHMVAFMGACKDPKNFKSLYEAADFASRFSGDYRRLGSFEKNVLKETFGFYSWYRFIIPHTMKQMAENPQRYAAWQRAFNYQLHKNSQNVDVMGQAFPEWSRGFTYPASEELQPDKYGGDEHQFAISNMETPGYMGLGLFPTIFGGMIEGSDRSMTDLLGPAVKSVVEMMSGRDMNTGRVIPEWYKLKNDAAGLWTEDTHLGNALYGLIERPSKEYMSLINLYSRQGNTEGAADLWQRYQAGRVLQGLDHLAAQGLVGVEHLLGLQQGELSFEPKSIGGMLQTGSPTYTYLGDAPKVADQAVRQAEKRSRQW